jgi:DNA-binding transcriptional regulator YiaG
MRQKNSNTAPFSPTGPARALLKIVASDPKSAIEALHA